MKRAGDDVRQLPPGGVRTRSRSTKLNRISLRPTFVSSADDHLETSRTPSNPPDVHHHIPDVHIPSRPPGQARNHPPLSQQDVQRQSGRRIIQAQIIHDDSAVAEGQANTVNLQPARTVPKICPLTTNDSDHHANVLGDGEMPQDARKTNQTPPKRTSSQERSPNRIKIPNRLPDRSKIQNKWSKITSRTSPSTTGFLPLKESVIIGESPVCVIEANGPLEEPVACNKSLLIAKHSSDQVEVIDTSLHPLCHAETSSRSGFFLPTPRTSPDRDFLVPSRPAQKKWRSHKLAETTSKLPARKLKRIEDKVSIPCSNQTATSSWDESCGNRNVLFRLTEPIQFGSFQCGHDYSKQNPFSQSPKTLSDQSPKSLPSSDSSPLQPKVVLQNISKFLSASGSESGYSGCVSADSLDLALSNIKGPLDFHYNQDRNCYSDTDSEIILNRDRKRKHRFRKKNDKASSIKHSAKLSKRSNRCGKVNDCLAGPQLFQVSGVADLRDFDSDEYDENCNYPLRDNCFLGSQGDSRVSVDQTQHVSSLSPKVSTKTCIHYSKHRHALSESGSESSDSKKDNRKRKLQKLSVENADIPSDRGRKEVLEKWEMDCDSVSSHGKNSETPCVSKMLTRSVAGREHRSESNECDIAIEVRQKKPRKCNVSKAESRVRTGVSNADSESQDEWQQTVQIVTSGINTHNAIATSGWRKGRHSQSSGSDTRKGKKNVSKGGSKPCEGINSELQDRNERLEEANPSSTESSVVSVCPAQRESVVSEMNAPDFNVRKNTQLNSQAVSESDDASTKDKRKITKVRSEVSDKKLLQKKKTDKVSNTEENADTNISAKITLAKYLSEKSSSNPVSISPFEKGTSSSTDTAETEESGCNTSSDERIVSRQNVLKKTQSKKLVSCNPSKGSAKCIRNRAVQTVVPETSNESIETDAQIMRKGYVPKPQLCQYPKARRKPFPRISVSNKKNMLSQSEESVAEIQDHKSSKAMSVPPVIQTHSLVRERHHLDETVVRKGEASVTEHPKVGKSVENVKDAGKCRGNMDTTSTRLLQEGEQQSQSHETSISPSQTETPVEKTVCSKSPLLVQMLTSKNYNPQIVKAVNASDGNLVSAQQPLTEMLEAGAYGDEITVAVPSVSSGAINRQMILCGLSPAPGSASAPVSQGVHSFCDPTEEENQLQSVPFPCIEKHNMPPANPVNDSENVQLSMTDKNPGQNIPGSKADSSVGIFSGTDSESGSFSVVTGKCGSKDSLRLSSSLWKKVVQKKPRGRPRKVKSHDICLQPPQMFVLPNLCIPLYKDVKNSIVWRPEYNNFCHQDASPFVVMTQHKFEHRKYHIGELEALGLVSEDIKISKPLSSVDLQADDERVVMHGTLCGGDGMDDSSKIDDCSSFCEAPALESPFTKQQVGPRPSNQGPAEASEYSSDVVHNVSENLSESVNFSNMIKASPTDTHQEEVRHDFKCPSEQRWLTQYQHDEGNGNKQFYPKEQSVEMRPVNEPVNISSTFFMFNEIMDDLLPSSVRRNEGQSPVSELSSGTSSKSLGDKDVFDCEVALDDTVKTDDLYNEGIAIVSHLVHEFLPIPDTGIAKGNVADKVVKTSVKKIKTACSSLSKLLHKTTKSLEQDSSPSSLSVTSEAGICASSSERDDQNRSRPGPRAFSSEANRACSADIQNTSIPDLSVSVSKDQTEVSSSPSISSVPVSIELTGLDLSALLGNKNPTVPSCHSKHMEKNPNSHGIDVCEDTADAGQRKAVYSLQFSDNQVGTETGEMLDCRHVVRDEDALRVKLHEPNRVMESERFEDTDGNEGTGVASDKKALYSEVGVRAGEVVVNADHRDDSDRLEYVHDGHGVCIGEGVRNREHVEAKVHDTKDKYADNKLACLHSERGVYAGKSVNPDHVGEKVIYSQVKDGNDVCLHSGPGVCTSETVVNTDYVEGRADSGNDKDGSDRLGCFNGLRLHDGQAEPNTHQVEGRVHTGTDKLDCLNSVCACEAVVTTDCVENHDDWDQQGCLQSRHVAGDTAVNTDNKEDQHVSDQLGCIDKSHIDVQAERLGMRGCDLQPRLILFCLSMKRTMKFGRHKYRRIGGKKSQTWKVRLKQKYRKKRKKTNHSHYFDQDHSDKCSIQPYSGPDLSRSKRSTGDEQSLTDVTDFGLAISTPKERNKRKPKKDVCVLRKGSGLSQKQGVSLSKSHHDLENATQMSMPESKLAQSILKKEEERRKRAASASQQTCLDLPALVPFEQILDPTDQTACTEKETLSTLVSSVMSFGESDNLFSPPKTPILKKIRKKQGCRSSDEDISAKSPLEHSYGIWPSAKYGTEKRTFGLMNSSFTDKPFTFGSSFFNSHTFQQEITSPIRPAPNNDRPGTESVKESLLSMLEGTGAIGGESPSSCSSNSSRRRVSVTISPVLDTVVPSKKAKEILSTRGILKKSPVKTFVPKGYYEDTLQSDVETDRLEDMETANPLRKDDVDDTEAEKVTFLVSPSSPEEATLAIQDMEPENESIEFNTVQMAGVNESSKTEVDKECPFDNTDLSAMEETVGFTDNLLPSNFPLPRNQVKKGHSFSEDFTDEHAHDLESESLEPYKETIEEETLKEEESVACKPSEEQRARESDDDIAVDSQVQEDNHGVDFSYDKNYSASFDEEHGSDDEEECGADANSPHGQSSVEVPVSKDESGQAEISEKSDDESDPDESNEEREKSDQSDEDGNSDADSVTSVLSVFAPSDASFLDEDLVSKPVSVTTKESSGEALKHDQDVKLQDDLDLQDNHSEEDMDLSSGCSVKSGSQPEPAIPVQVVKTLGVPEGYCVNFVRNTKCKHSPCKYKHRQPSKEDMISMVFKDLRHLMSTDMHHLMFAKFDILATYYEGDVSISGEVLQCMLRWAMRTDNYSHIGYLLPLATTDPNLLLYVRDAIQMMVHVMQNPLKEDVKPVCLKAVSSIFNWTRSQGLILTTNCLTQLLQVSLHTLMLQDVVIYCQQQKHAVPSSIMQVALLSNLDDISFREKAELILHNMTEKSVKVLGIEVIEQLSTVQWSPEKDTQHKVMRVYQTMTAEPYTDLVVNWEDEELEKEVQPDSEDYKGIYHMISGCRQSMNWKYLAQIYMIQCTSHTLPNSKFLRVYVDVLHDKQDSLKTASYFHAFLNNVFSQYQEDILMDALLSLDRRTLARIGFHLLVRTFKSPPYGQCCTLVADLLDNDLPCNNLRPEMGYSFHSTVMEVCLQTTQLDRLLQFIQGLCPTDVFAHGSQERPDLWQGQLLWAINLLCSKSRIPEAADVLAFFHTQIPETDALLRDHHIKVVGQLMELALCQGDLDTAIKVFDNAKTSLQINHLRQLLLQCFHSNMCAKALDIFSLLRPFLTNKNSQNLIKITNSFHFIEIEMIIRSHLVNLYRHLCQLWVTEGRTPTDANLALMVTVDDNTNLMPKSAQDTLKEVMLIFSKLGVDSRQTIPYGVMVDINTLKEYIRGCDEQARNLGLFRLSPEESHPVNLFESQGRYHPRETEFTKVKGRGQSRGQCQSRNQSYNMRGYNVRSQSHDVRYPSHSIRGQSHERGHGHNRGRARGRYRRGHLHNR
ncbi:uncharacterized protein [Haliotis asinina]|uniref:uncharacterized protein n=1 Tax=Haliotis asinina TaxID=109174 RepID=UPI003531CB4B